MKCSSPKETILFLWQNKNTVVIGRNQNPYKECDTKQLEKDGTQLIRRLSGGGAVYHDKGNLNFTFIDSDENYDLERNMKVILNGISKFGIQGYFNGRNDLMVEERKFSGNAFISDNGMNCHHGTLLVDVDLEKLSKYLTVSPLKLESKGIDSVTSRVVNLKEISRQITIEGLKDSLMASFNELYKTEAQVIKLNEKAVDLTTYLEKYNSWEWNFSESPNFSVAIEEKFSWGIFEIYLEFCDGEIKRCKLFTDAIILENFGNLEKMLKNKLFKRNEIIEVIEQCIKNEEIRIDICSMIKDKFP